MPKNLEEITISNQPKRKIDWPATITYLPTLAAYMCFGSDWLEENVQTSKTVQSLFPLIFSVWVAGAFVLRAGFEKSAKLIRNYIHSYD